MPDFTGRKTFTLVLIKPSHYDDDGYVIQWLRSAIPSNTLAVLNGLALDCAARAVLGDDVDIVIEAVDETNTRVRPERIADLIRARGGHGLVALVGVQSNQFPRAVDIAAPLRRAGVQVAIGGFHVSGCLAMLPDMPPDLRAAQALGVSLFAGEAEGRLDMVLRDAHAGRLAPLYDFMADLPGLDGVPTPLLPAARIERTGGKMTSFRRRPRLPVPVLLLHDHQRAGPQVALSLAGGRRAHRARQPRPGHHALLHHGRQPRPQQELGADVRPAHRHARGRGPALQHGGAGRHPVPPHPGLHRKGGARRRHPRLPRPRKHQPRFTAGCEEEAEPHLRIPDHAARMEEARLLHLCGLHPRFPDRHPRDHRPGHRDHQARVAARPAGVSSA